MFLLGTSIIVLFSKELSILHMANLVKCDNGHKNVKYLTIDLARNINTVYINNTLLEEIENLS